MEDKQLQIIIEGVKYDILLESLPLAIIQGDEGYNILYNGKVYDLLEGHTIGGKNGQTYTSDILFILENGTQYINHMFGATFFLEELAKKSKTRFYQETIDFFKWSIDKYESEKAANQDERGREQWQKR